MPFTYHTELKQAFEIFFRLNVNQKFKLIKLKNN